MADQPDVLLVHARQLPPLRPEGQRLYRWTDGHDALLGRVPDATLRLVWNVPVGAVRSRRIALGIAASRVRPRVRWSRGLLAMLGRKPDLEISARFGISIPAICKKRCELGIRAYSKRLWTPPMVRVLTAALGTTPSPAVLDNLPPWEHPVIRAHLRDHTSIGLERAWGVRASIISSWRQRAGIESCLRRRWTQAILARLGREPDTWIARDMGVDVSTVAWQRKKRGIPVCQRFIDGQSRSARNRLDD